MPRLWRDGLGAMTTKGWCPNSGTYASFTERGLVGESTIAAGHARCEHCGRLLKLHKNNVLPHHRVTTGSSLQPRSQGDKSQ